MTVLGLALIATPLTFVASAPGVLRLDARRSGRKGRIGRRCRQHDHVDVARLDPGIGQRIQRRQPAQIGGELIIGRDMPPPDSGAGENPLVRRIDQCR